MLSILFVTAAIALGPADFARFSTHARPAIERQVTTVDKAALDKTLIFLKVDGHRRQMKALSARHLPVTSSLIAMREAQNRNGIGGYIFDTSRRPVVNLRVELLDEVDSIIATTRSDSSGRYSFQGLSQGTFQVRVLPDGTNFIGQTARVQISNFSHSTSSGGRVTTGAQFEQMDFTLKSRDEAKASSRPMTTGTTFAQNVPESARLAYERALQNLDKKNDADQGIAELEEAVGLFPTYYLALERLGAEYVKRQKYEPAVTTLSRAIEVNPNGSSSFYVLGVARYYLKQIPEAIESFRRSMSLSPSSPNSPFLHMYMGMALLKSGKTVEAEAQFKQAHEKGGNLVADVHMHLAQMYSNEKRYKEAADELEIFLKEAPEARDAERIKEIIKQLRAKAK